MYEPDRLITWRLHVFDASVRSVRMQMNVCRDDDEATAELLLMLLFVLLLTIGDDDDDEIEDDERESEVALLLLLDVDETEEAIVHWSN